ncbi:MAG: putative bifunctional diguanylate cyclase/phosphodiesterase [Solirubrobacteraceae bacterium]
MQSLVADQAPPDDAYQAVVDGAVALLGADSGALRYVDADDPKWMVAVAWSGATETSDRWQRRAPVSEGASGRVISGGRPVALLAPASERVRSQLAPAGTHAVMGVPLRERGHVVGALVVGTRDPRRRWSRSELRLLGAYGRQVEVALAVARAGHGTIMALTDPLTGLGNRALLLDRLERRLAQAHRGGRPATVLFLDLDRFKLVNDSLGHAVGDRLLVAVAERLRACLREGDVCARLGGDEFAILLAPRSNAEAVARRIIEDVDARYEIDGHDVFVGVSVGIASGREQAATLLRNADVAMYHAKRRGRGRFARFRSSMHTERLSRLDVDAQLRRGVERGDLELHFQPIVGLGSGAIVAFESLVRWRHPERGLVGPADFIPVAEETGLILEIDRWVRREACRQLRVWSAYGDVSVSFNATMRDLEQPEFAAGIEAAIGGAFEPSRLILEVTETAALEDAPGALASLHAVKELGLQIALDDFGTGYSSLLGLARLPIDVVKIARPFVARAGRDAKATGLLAGMVGLGRHMGVTTVAEGVETRAQRDLLHGLGCDAAQGWLLGRPTDASGATELLLGLRAAA